MSEQPAEPLPTASVEPADPLLTASVEGQPADPLLTASADGDEHGEAVEGQEAAEDPPPRPAASGCWKCTAGAAALVAVLAAAGAAAWFAAPATVRRGAGELMGGADELLGPARQMLEPSKPSRAMTAPPPHYVPSGSGSQVEVQFFWLHHITRCVGVDGEVEAGAGLVLVGCEDPTMEGPVGFTMPEPKDPFIRVAEKPDLCVHNPTNTSKLRLRRCNGTDNATTNMQFFLQASPGNRSSGSVRTLQNSSMCMGSAKDQLGAPVEVNECTDTDNDVFMLNLVIEGSALGTALEPARSSPKAEATNVRAEAEAVAMSAEAAAMSAWTQATNATQSAAQSATNATQSAAQTAQKIAQDSLGLVGGTAKNWTGWWR